MIGELSPDEQPELDGALRYSGKGQSAKAAANLGGTADFRPKAKVFLFIPGDFFDPALKKDTDADYSALKGVTNEFVF
jgi:hypothetical protein